MKGCILGPLKKDECGLDILREGKKIFDEFFYVPIPEVRMNFKDGAKVFYKNRNLAKLDFIIPRIPRTYVNLGFIILNILKDKLYLPITPESILISHNKFLTLLRLKEAGLPVPKTYLATSRQSLEDLLDKMRFPVVMKLLYGSLGKGVMFADSKGSAISLMDALERVKEPILLEEYIPNPGEDIRAFVLGGDVLTAMKRKATKRGERRANIAVGGIGKPIKIGLEQRDLAIKAAKALGMEICGIDLLEGRKGPVIIEANVNVHFEGLKRATGIEVAKEIVEYVRNEVEEIGKTMIERVLRRVGFK
ncbi:MAG: RimK family alpha-L-glutamate ligase [Candidatus Aenigmarchaeota archaeon]|nr:RimK family alpha-L-glutamate ligase [Candidatus Aenigmarchaeota archaeon]